MIDLRQLKYFVAVAEEEHVGRAAERLHISQSPLSRQISQLEERLGLMLFERNQQRIRLTADGQTFLAETRALLTHATGSNRSGAAWGGGKTAGCASAISKMRCTPASCRTHCGRCGFPGRMCTSCFTASLLPCSWKGCGSAAWT